MDRIQAIVKRRNPESPIVAQRFGGAEVSGYIRGLLEWADPLSVALRSLPIEQGAVYGFVPEGLVLERPKDIEWPLPSLRGHHREVEAMAQDFVKRYLTQADSIALFQTLLSEGDGALQKVPVPIAYFEPRDSAEQRKRLLCLILTERPTNESVVGAFRHSGPFLAVLTRWPEESEKLKPDGELSAHASRRLADATQHLIAEAFDGDSYFIWSRDPNQFLPSK